MLDAFRGFIVSSLLFFFTIAAISRLLTAKQTPGLITSAADGLSNLFTNARS